MTLPYLIANNRRGPIAFLGKMFGVLVLLGGTYFLTSQAQSFLRFDSVSGGVRVINDVNRNNRYGPAAFGKEESFASKALAAPVLLFRPFIWEAHNLPSGMSSIESVALFWLLWRRRKNLMAAVSRWRANSFIAFLVLYSIEFSIIFAGAISNFGLLVRQRVMLLPFVIMLLSATAGQLLPKLSARQPYSGPRPSPDPSRLINLPYPLQKRNS